MKKLDLLYNTFLKLGLGISLLLAIIAFNYTTYGNPEIEVVKEFIQDKEIEIIRTAQRKKVSPPPPAIETISKEILAEVQVFQSDPIHEAQPLEIDSSATETDSSDHSDWPISSDNPSHAAEGPPIVLPVDTTTYLPFQIERMPFLGDCYGLNDEERKTCSDLAFKKFLAKHTKYPGVAAENGISGTVVVRFIVDKEGYLTDFSIVRDPGGGLAQEAIRVFKEMPKWAPGIQNGRPVRVIFTAPVRFTLH